MQKLRTASINSSSINAAHCTNEVSQTKQKILAEKSVDFRHAPLTADFFFSNLSLVDGPNLILKGAGEQRILDVPALSLRASVLYSRSASGSSHRTGHHMLRDLECGRPRISRFMLAPVCSVSSFRVSLALPASV